VDHSGIQSYTREFFQKLPLCPSGVTGNCQYEPNCQFIHGAPCPSCSKFVLHPYHTPQQHQAHITECISKNSHQSADIKCGICHEIVLSKPDGCFGILNCEHPFCINCIQEWQANQSQENEPAAGCPQCHEISHVIIPSTTWTVERAQKQHLFNEYKYKLSKTPCKHFNSPEKQCPFGNSCLYAHESLPLRNNGSSFYTKSPQKIQTTKEVIRALGSPTLSDVIGKCDISRS
ncbi:E3 ubiquitin-protein ligase makorin-1, partial [Basidiobolus ranarum]